MFFSVPNLSEHNRLVVINDLSNEVKSKNDILESTLKEYNKIEIQMQTNIDTTRVENAKLDQEIKIKEKQIVENTSEIKKLKEVVEQVTKIIYRFLIIYS